MGTDTEDPSCSRNAASDGRDEYELEVLSPETAGFSAHVPALASHSKPAMALSPSEEEHGFETISLAGHSNQSSSTGRKQRGIPRITLPKAQATTSGQSVISRALGVSDITKIIPKTVRSSMRTIISSADSTRPTSTDPECPISDEESAFRKWHGQTRSKGKYVWMPKAVPLSIDYLTKLNSATIEEPTGSSESSQTRASGRVCGRGIRVDCKDGR